jgi:hypothetical protein
MSSNTINANGSNNSQFLNTMISNGAAAAGNNNVSSDQSHSWFEALAKAWGNALDQEANKVTALSDQVSNGSDANASGQSGTTTSNGTNGTNGGGSDNPSTLTQLTAESLKMQFLSTSASTSINAVGQGLQTEAQKQG